MRAVRHAANEVKKRAESQVLLLRVVEPCLVQAHAEFWQASGKSRFLNGGEKLVVWANLALKETGVACAASVKLGSARREIASFARRSACHSIVI